MYSYELLEQGCYYVIQEKEKGPLSLVKINLASDHCHFVSKYEETEVMEWKKKTDPIYDIVELLSDDAVKAWHEAWYNNQGAYYEEEDEE